MSSKKQDYRQSLLGSNTKKPIKPVLLKQKRPIIQQFNPALYITRQLTQEDVMLIKQAFDSYDSNGMGLLTPNDLKQAFFNIGFFASKQTIYQLMAQCDQDSLGGLTFDAFMRVIGRNPTEMQNSNDLKKLFRKYDKQNKGYIGPLDLLSVSKNLTLPMNQEQCRKFFKNLDQKGKGKIQFQQFCLLMHHPNSLK